MKKIITIVPLLMISSCMFAQEANQNTLSSGGDYKENTNGSVSWTLGEIATESYNDNKLAQGFQQGWLQVTTSLENEEINISCFPNPTTSYITLKMDDSEKELKYILYTANGSMLESDRIDESKEINFTKYSSGSYIISILTPDGKEKQFTIIKH